LSFYRNTSSENLAMRQHACAFLPSLATKILRQIPSTYLRTVPYCIERELFSANDFRDTLEYFAVKQPIIPCRKVGLDIKYAAVSVQIRDLSVYCAIAADDSINAVRLINIGAAAPNPAFFF